MLWRTLDLTLWMPWHKTFHFTHSLNVMLGMRFRPICQLKHLWQVPTQFIGRNWTPTLVNTKRPIQEVPNRTNWDALNIFNGDEVKVYDVCRKRAIEMSTLWTPWVDIASYSLSTAKSIIAVACFWFSDRRRSVVLLKEDGDLDEDWGLPRTNLLQLNVWLQICIRIRIRIFISIYVYT